MDGLFDIDFNSLSDDNLIDISAEGSIEDAGEESQEDVQVEDIKKPEVKDTKPEEIDNTIEIDEASEEEDSDGNNSGPSSGEASSPFTPFASLLHDKGFLSNIDWDEFNATEDKIEALTNAVGREIEEARKAAIDNYLASLPKELTDMAEAIMRGVPLDSIKDDKIKEINYSKFDIDSLSDNVDLQKRVMSEYLATKGFKQAKIDSYIDKLEGLDSLEEESKDAITELAEIYKQKQELKKQEFEAQQKQLEESNKQIVNDIRKSVDNTEAIIPGMKLTPAVKDKLFNNMTKIVGQDEYGNPQNFVMKMRSENPLQFDMAITYLAEVTKGFKDWSKLGTSAKSAAAKELEKNLQTSNLGMTGKPKGIRTGAPQAQEDLLASLEEMFTKKK